MLILKLEALAGSNVTRTAQQMQTISQQLSVITEVCFNDVELFGKPGMHWAETVKAYDAAIERRKEGA